MEPWSIFYLASTFFVILFSWALSKRVGLTCSIALLFWFILANYTYKLGVIEDLSTQINGLIFIAICFWLINKYHHWLPWVLAISTAGMMVWTAMYEGNDAYMYKAVKNLIYFGELLAVCISWIPWMNTKTT